MFWETTYADEHLLIMCLNSYSAILFNLYLMVYEYLLLVVPALIKTNWDIKLQTTAVQISCDFFHLAEKYVTSWTDGSFMISHVCPQTLTPVSDLACSVSAP